MRWLTTISLGFGALARLAHATSCTGVSAVSPNCTSKEVAYKRDYFYIGGEYVYSESLSGSIFSDQLYVEKLTPQTGVNQTNPIVFISAGVPSGAVWLNTLDNRRGWASYFLDHGYQVYILDITSVGRSSQPQFSIYPLKIGSTDNITRNCYTSPETIMPYPQAINHTQWPGTGIRGDAIFDSFMASMIPLTSNATSLELSMRKAGCQLLEMIGSSFLISHSAGSTYATLLSDQCPNLIKANVNIEPGNTPFQSLVGNSTVPAVGRTSARPYGLTTTEIGYVPALNSSADLETVWVGDDLAGNRSCVMQTEPARQLPNIAKVPYVAITGAASPHITYDHCIINYLKQVGVDPEWIKLEDRGILGNGHFMYLEKNSDEIAAVVLEWMQSR
ncbi:Alpha/Beta hydrolase protein [Phyllosticta citribraziliensis]|uniref:Alpha/Beta hydrolase protein n=1 Tax=Phyllosticta citribraziliensis TaxID=989973 RepID=A0ABR1LI75_9PEZI